MDSLFLVLFLISLVGLVIGLIKPAWLRMPSRKRASLIAGGSTLFFFVLFGITAPPAPKNEVVAKDNTVQQTKQTPPASAPEEKPVATPAANETSKADAQKELADFMALSKKAEVISSYDFTNDAVVYVDQMWYQMTVPQKKDFIAHIGILKKAATGFSHFELRDAYSNDKVGEITSFSQSVEVYK